MMDADGYGYRPDERGIARLLQDFRTLSPAGIERAAQGWRHHAGPDPSAIRGAEQAALRALEKAERAPDWEDLRRSLFQLTEGRQAMVAWKAEHGEIGHHAESAADAAALAVFGAALIDRDTYLTLVEPMADALPWLTTSAPATAAPSQ
jgi:hypothetical protein